MAIEPAARPSKPSVKLTALDQALTTTTQNNTKSAGASVTVALSRTYDKSEVPGVNPASLRNCKTSTPTRTAAVIWPTVLAVLFSPKLRDRRSLIRSSTNPTAPSVVARNSTSRPDADGPLPLNIRPAKGVPT